MPLLDDPPTPIEWEAEPIPCPLTGSRRQIAWATKIRTSALPAVRGYVSEAVRLLPEQYVAYRKTGVTPFDLAYAKRGVEMLLAAELELCRRVDARWWTANYNSTPIQLLQRASLAVKNGVNHKIAEGNPASVFDPVLSRRGRLVDFAESEVEGWKNKRLGPYVICNPDI